MKIKVDGSILLSTIKTLQKVVSVQQISFRVKGNFASVVGIGNGNSFAMTCPVQVVSKSNENAFTIGATNILDAVSGHKEVDIEIQSSAVIVTDKRYRAELLVTPYEKVVVVPEEVRSGDGLKIKDKFLNVIRENLPKLELKPLMAMYDYIPFGIKATKEGTFISCFDFFQSAFYFDKELKGNLEFTLPSNIFGILAKELKGQDYVMALTDTTVYAYNENFQLAIARPQTEGQQITLDNMISLYADLKKNNKATKIVFKKEGVSGMIENAKAVYEKDSTFTFSTKGDKCKLELRSSFGKSERLIMLDEKPEKDVTFSCDFNFFSTLLAKAPTTVELRVTDKLMLFSNKPVTYLLSLV